MGCGRGRHCGMHGPPRDFSEFCATWEVIIKRYPEIDTYEFWNEPWIFGWTWAADAVEYRNLQKQFFERALKANPKLRLIAGNSSMFCEDHIEAYPDCWKGLLQGVTTSSLTTGSEKLEALEPLREARRPQAQPQQRAIKLKKTPQHLDGYHVLQLRCPALRHVGEKAWRQNSDDSIPQNADCWKTLGRSKLR